MKNNLKHPQIKAIIDHYENGNSSQLAKKLGISNSNMSNVMYRNVKISFEIKDKLMKLYPIINPDFINGTSQTMHILPAQNKKGKESKPIAFKEVKYSDEMITKRFVKVLNHYKYINGSLSDADICRSLEIYASTLSAFKSGDRAINLKIVTLMAEKFKINPTYIILGVGNEYM